MPKPPLLTNGRIGILDRRPAPYGLAGMNMRAKQRFTISRSCWSTLHLIDSEGVEIPDAGAISFEGGSVESKSTRAYCGECQLIGAAERTRLSRQRKKKKLLHAVAEAWPRWTKSNRNPVREDWVVREVSKRTGTVKIQRKWVSRTRRPSLSSWLSGRSAALIQVSPVWSHTHLHQQRDCQRVDFLHLLADQRLHCVDFPLGNFEDQFVMHLQSHPRLQSALA